MITTPEIICDVFSFLDKDQIERIQLVNQLWNNVIIRHKNIWSLRQFSCLNFSPNIIHFYVTEEDWLHIVSYQIKFDGTNLSKIEDDISSRYSQLTVDEALKNLNDVVFDTIRIQDGNSEDNLDNILVSLKLVTTKTGGKFRGRYGLCFGKFYSGSLYSKLDKIFGKGFLNTVRYKIHPS
jgi:L-cysteine desulfidase